jgi:hypothetical protein
MKKALILLLLITCTLSYSQKKTLKTVLINGGITIDGNLNETHWQTAPVAKDFFMFAPDNGKEVAKGKGHKEFFLAKPTTASSCVAKKPGPSIPCGAG